MENLEKFPETFLRKGETLFRQGDPAVALYIFFDGSLAFLYLKRGSPTRRSSDWVVEELRPQPGTIVRIQ